MGQERAGKGRKRKMASTWRHPAASPSPTPGRLARVLSALQAVRRLCEKACPRSAMRRIEG